MVLVQCGVERRAWEPPKSLVCAGVGRWKETPAPQVAWALGRKSRKRVITPCSDESVDVVFQDQWKISRSVVGPFGEEISGVMEA